MVVKIVGMMMVKGLMELYIQQKQQRVTAKAKTIAMMIKDTKW